MFRRSPRIDSATVVIQRRPGHPPPEFPEGYWPASPEPASASAWDESVAAFQRDNRAFIELTADESIDLYARIPHGTGQTVLREILLAVDHNAYHIGQLMLVRRVLERNA